MKVPDIDTRKAVSVAFLTALVLRVVFLIAFALSPLFQPIEGGNDRSLYLRLAQEVGAGRILPDDVFQYMPLYPLVLGAVAALAGDGVLMLAGLLGAFMDAITSAVIVLLALRFGARPFYALVAALLYATYPLAIVFSSVTMPNTLNTMLLVLFTLAASGLTGQGKMSRWFGVGLLAGVGALGFAGFVLIVMVCAVYWLVLTVKREVGALCVPVFLIAFAIPIAPVTIHNYRVSGETILITAHGGFNFFMGNHKGATGYPTQIKGFRGDQGSLLIDAMREAEQATGHKLTPAGFSRYWSDQAKAFWREHPGEAAKLFAIKFAKFFNLAEYDDMRLLPSLRLTGLGQGWAWWPSFALISALGLAGLLSVRGSTLPRLVTATAIFSVILFFVTSRYRMTSAPLLAACAAWGITQAHAGTRRGLWTALCLACGVLALWPLKQLTDFRALDHYNVAAHFLDRGLAEEALDQADRGLAIAPQTADLHFVRGNALFGLDRLDEAKAAYIETLKLNPRKAQAHFNIAVVFSLQGDLVTARQAAGEAVKIDPDFQMAKDFLKSNP